MNTYRRYLLAVCAAALLLSGCGANSGDRSSVYSDVNTDKTHSTSADVEHTTAQSQQSTATAGNSTASGGGSTPTAATTATQAGSVTSSRRTVSTTSRKTTTTAGKTTFADTDVFPVEPTLSARQAAARVNNKLASTAQKIASTYIRVSDFRAAYAFAHHPGLAYFKDKLYYCYSRGYVDEDAPGQSMVVRSSSDFYTWSEETVIGPSFQGTYGMTGNVSGYFYNAGDTLYAYYMAHDYKVATFNEDGSYNPGVLDTRRTYKMMTYTTDGVNWSEPVEVSFAANESPRRTLTGQWLAGAGSRLLSGLTDTPDGKSWTLIGMTTAQYNSSVARGGLKYLTEASWYQTDDFIIHQMLRSEDGYVWMCESYDNGKSWTEAYPTGFTSDASMTNFGRLPDGRYYCVCNPNHDGSRFPLMLYVSENGYDFDKGYILRNEPYAMQQSGWSKGGAYAYPEVLIHGEYRYVAYSQMKEIMGITRVKLSDI